MDSIAKISWDKCSIPDMLELRLERSEGVVPGPIQA